MSSEAERAAAASTGDEPRRFLDLLMGPGGGRSGEGFVLFPAIIGVMGPRGGEGEEATAADRIVLLSPLGMLVLRAEDGGVDLASMVHDIISADGGTAAGPPPASKASIEAMRMVERPAAAEAEAGAEGDMEECAVCLDGLWVDGEGKGPEATVKEMPCRHRFHGGCIEKWLGLHGSCPVCRYRMPEEEKAGGKKGAGEEGEGEEEEDDAARRQMEEQQQQQQQQQQQEERQQQGEQQEQAMEDID